LTFFLRFLFDCCFYQQSGENASRSAVTCCWQWHYG